MSHVLIAMQESVAQICNNTVVFSFIVIQILILTLELPLFLKVSYTVILPVDKLTFLMIVPTKSKMEREV